MPVVVLSAHNQCNCRCAMCDIWRIREPKQITPADLEAQLDSLGELGVCWVVFSGGEAQLNPELFTLAQMLRRKGIRITLLTAGLLLEFQAQEITGVIDDVIVSLDGPPQVHNQIRRVANAFEQMAAGVRAIRNFRPDMQVSARCTVQRANHAHLFATVEAAKEIGLNSISFLAADVTSSAFNREQGWPAKRQETIALSAEEVEVLSREVERLHPKHASGFVVESPTKLRRIVDHFRAHLRHAEHVAPICNAPWVSAVIEATGDVRPCFFHPAFGNIHDKPLHEVVNSPAALQFRANLDVATNPTCRQCVCSLHIQRNERTAQA